MLAQILTNALTFVQKCSLFIELRFLLHFHHLQGSDPP